MTFRASGTFKAAPFVKGFGMANKKAVEYINSRKISGSPASLQVPTAFTRVSGLAIFPRALTKRSLYWRFDHFSRWGD